MMSNSNYLLVQVVMVQVIEQTQIDFAFTNINSDDNSENFETEVNQSAVNVSGAITQGNAGESGSFI